MYFKGKKFDASQARRQISVYRKITITCSNHEATTFRLNRNLATLLRQQAISSETDRNSAPLNYYFETLYFHPPKPYSRLGRGTRIKNGSTPVGSARMRYQRCTLCRKTKISYSLVPFSSPCNRSSNFIVNHHVSVLFSPLSLSLSLSFLLSLCLCVFLRPCAPLYTEQLFPLSLPAVSNNNEESKRSIGQRESHPLPECICSGAPRISATVSPLCIENFHPP